MNARHIIVWDLETIPDLGAVARLHGLDLADQDAVREALGSGFPKLPLHSIACIGALVARRDAGGWQPIALGAPHIGERTEGELIASFIERIGELNPLLVTFNGHSFDLPVLRYRAMVHRVSGEGLQRRRYFYRYGSDAIDLCDELSAFDSRGKVKLDEICKILGLPGKPGGIDGSQVDDYVQAGRIQEVADYCESDVVNTYRVFLIYELFKGALSEAGLEASEQHLAAFLEARRERNPHL
jgi:predicted PolB exonuclease-like 3'-5' exonuclease